MKKLLTIMIFLVNYQLYAYDIEIMTFIYDNYNFSIYKEDYSDYNYINVQENKMDELKNILNGSAKLGTYSFSYLLWEYISPIEDYNYTKLQFQSSKVFFYYIRLYPNKAYTIMEENGHYEVKNNIIKICFEIFSIVQNNEVERQRDVIDEKNLKIELEVEIYND